MRIAVLNQDRTIVCEPKLLQVRSTGSNGKYEIIGLIDGAQNGYGSLGVYPSKEKAVAVIQQYVDFARRPHKKFYAYRGTQLSLTEERTDDIFEMPKEDF